MVPQVALKLGSPLRVVPRSDEKVQKDRPVESAALESVHDRGRGSRRRALIAERGLPGALLWGNAYISPMGRQCVPKEAFRDQLICGHC